MTLEGGAGIELWAPFVRQVHGRTLELLPDGGLRVTGTARLSTKGFTTATCSEVTQYQGLPGLTGPVVQVEVEGGEWTTLALEGATRAVKAAAPAPGANPGLLQGIAANAPVEAAPAAAASGTEARPKPGPSTWRPLAGAQEVVKESRFPVGAKAVRIRLPSGACVVEDRYVEPLVVGGAVFHNVTTGVLSVRVDLDEVPVPVGGEGTWMVRELKFLPLAAGPAGGAP